MTTKNPYGDLPDHAFWRKAVASTPWNLLDPMVEDIPLIAKDTKIASAGSCFAQYVAKFLRANGYRYYVAEGGGKDNDAGALFSARYGNIYNSRQLLQLFQRSYGEFNITENEHVWRRRDNGLFVDAFRPDAAAAFASVEEVIADRENHLAKVRDVFENMDVFIFTLGLTEGWVRRGDWAAYPVAPGVMDDGSRLSDFDFINLSVAEVVADYSEFIARVRALNSDVAIILTVSPVPLIASYAPGHVLVSNCYSKSVLRAAAGEICEKHDRVFYFPAYEMITGTYSMGRFYQSNLRSVTDAAVNMVMHLFMKHFIAGGRDEPKAAYAVPDNYDNVICEPELLLREQENSCKAR